MAKLNKPGVREKNGGLVIQFKKRSAQLESIAKSVQKLLERFGSDNGVIMPPDEAHRIDGWMEQLLIISDELKEVE